MIFYIHYSVKFLETEILALKCTKLNVVYWIHYKVLLSRLYKKYNIFYSEYVKLAPTIPVVFHKLIFSIISSFSLCHLLAVSY